MTKIKLTYFSLLLFFLFFFCCKNPKRERLSFLIDSLASSYQFYNDSIRFAGDSLINCVEEINIKLDEEKFHSLIEKIKSNERIEGSDFISLAPQWSSLIKIDADTILFPKVYLLSPDSTKLAITFDENLNWECRLFFISNYSLVGSINVFHHYGLELNSFTNEANETIFYCKHNFDSGTGIWWYNYFFYKLDNHGITPVLNQLANSNLAFPWSLRIYRIESKIVNTNPLQLKYYYTQAIYDTTKQDGQQIIVNDSSLVNFFWDMKMKSYRPDFSSTNFKQEQVFSFYLTGNGKLFIAAYKDHLKERLKDSTNHQGISNFLINALED